MTIAFVEESGHLTDLMAEGIIKLDYNAELDRQRAFLSRLANPYFSLPGFPKVCRHGAVPLEGQCVLCEKDKVDALRRLGN